MRSRLRQGREGTNETTTGHLEPSWHGGRNLPIGYEAVARNSLGGKGLNWGRKCTFWVERRFPYTTWG